MPWPHSEDPCQGHCRLDAVARLFTFGRPKAFSSSLPSNDASPWCLFSLSNSLVTSWSKNSSKPHRCSKWVLILSHSCYMHEGIRYQLSEICQKFKVFPKTRGDHLPFCEFCHCPMLASLPVHMTSGNHCGNYFRQYAAGGTHALEV